jgi:8-oxo-dGTP diphosphatase
LAAGARRVQIRARTLQGDRWQALASAAVQVCRDAKAEVLINGDIDLARRLGTGVQLRASQLHEQTERPLPADTLVAASCHTAEDLRLAESLGCDFAVLGSLRATATHPDAAALGWEGFARLREDVSLPIYAIGGLGPHDIAEARQHGAQGVAAIRAFWPE